MNEYIRMRGGGEVLVCAAGWRGWRTNTRGYRTLKVQVVGGVAGGAAAWAAWGWGAWGWEAWGEAVKAAWVAGAVWEGEARAAMGVRAQGWAVAERVVQACAGLVRVVQAWAGAVQAWEGQVRVVQAWEGLARVGQAGEGAAQAWEGLVRVGQEREAAVRGRVGG